MGQITFYERRGSPGKITPERTKLFCDARSIGSSYAASAIYAGVAVDTPKNWMTIGKKILAELAENPEKELTPHEDACAEFQLAVWEAEAAASMTWQQTINEASKVDPKWAWKMLERWYPSEYTAPATRLEHTGADGRPIEHAVQSTIQIFIPDNGRDSEAETAQEIAEAVIEENE